MKKLKRMLLAVAMLCVVSVSAFAIDEQKKDEQKRPPKPDRPVVVVGDKGQRPPPDNRQNPRNDNKRGRP
ncbi:MAG: hypothetical protein WCF57_17240 [Pyrinomonadaceae bacterium]